MPKYLGQHFLQNQSVVEKIIAAIEIKKGDELIEIGPGRGALTIQLAEAAGRIGAKLTAVERDVKLIESLKAIKSVEIVNDDALTFLAAQAFDPKKTKIVGNIPYYITGHLLRIIGDAPKKPERCIFMVQKEVAERITAKPPKMSRLSASIQIWGEPKIIASVGKANFSPPPQVDSSVILIKTKDSQVENLERYYSAVHGIFAQPRKTIINNLADALPERQKSDIAADLQKIEVDPKLRPQNLTISDIDRIAVKFF